MRCDALGPAPGWVRDHAWLVQGTDRPGRDEKTDGPKPPGALGACGRTRTCDADVVRCGRHPHSRTVAGQRRAPWAVVDADVACAMRVVHVRAGRPLFYVKIFFHAASTTVQVVGWSLEVGEFVQLQPVVGCD